MLFINKKRMIAEVGIGALVTLMLSGCGNTMDHTIDNQINKNKDQVSSTENKINEEKAGDTADSDLVVNDEEFKMSESQKKRLKEAKSQTAEEALSKDKKIQKNEVALNVPQAKDKFTEPKEFSQYISYLLYKYHSSEVPGKKFYNQSKKYMSDSFFDQLPKSDSERERTFVELQKMFKDQLSSEIDSYQITELEINERAKEASFYRKYTLKNGERVYYQTIIKKENSKWLLLDDSPSDSYEVENTNKKFQKANNKGE